MLCGDGILEYSESGCCVVMEYYNIYIYVILIMSLLSSSVPISFSNH